MLFVVTFLVVVLVGGWQFAHRTSPLVRRWSPSSFPRRAAGSLSVLDSGPTHRPPDEVLVILHGLGATGAYFGAFYDGLSRDRRVVIADLLGFGHSLDEDRRDFTVRDHVDALDEALAVLGLSDARVVVAAHSMSAAVALVWANENSDRVGHVYLWGPPIYPSEAAARSVAKEYGPMARLFLLETGWAERACRLSCANRDVSGQLMALASPRWPTALSRAASRHTWDAYHGSLHALVLDVDWTEALPAQVPVTIFRGTDDTIGDREFTRKVAGEAHIVDVPDGDHHLALRRPDLLFDALRRFDTL